MVRARSLPSSPDRRTRAAIVALGTVIAIGVADLVAHGSRGLNDFPREAWPALRALMHGHVGAFVTLAPSYIGSLVLRAPLLPIASLLGGGLRTTYVVTSIPCLAAPALLGAWLSPRRASPLVLYALNPIVVVCIGYGHPEDVLGATLCVAAVVLATRGSAGWAGLLIGLAVANKSWALVAVPVVFAVLPGDRRRALAAMVLAAGAILGPVLVGRELVRGAGGAASFGATTGTIFLPPQLLYWFGRGAWIVRQAHIVLVFVCWACTAAWAWLRRRRAAGPATIDEALALLALVFFLRAALDPWDNLYYQVPFLFALMAFEAGRWPKLTLLFSVALILVVPPHLLSMTTTAHAALYAAVALPTIAWLAVSAFRPQLTLPRPTWTARPQWSREELSLLLLGSGLGALVLSAIAFSLPDVTRFNDFQREAWPAYRALGQGHVLAFLRVGPAYIGSLVLRAPFALVALALGGGWRATYIATGVPCVVATVAVGVWLLRHRATDAHAALASRISPIVLCALNPVVLVGLGDGHPEEVLGAALCAAATVAALGGSAAAAGVLVGLAMINKSWAIVALPVVLVALPAGRRRALVVAIATTAAVLLPVYLARLSSDGAGAADGFGGATSTIFLYPELLWWLGSHSWFVREAHYLLVAVCAACAPIWWLVCGRHPVADPAVRRRQVLMLLAFVFLLRAALDPWDNLYYHLPFLFALMAFEVRRPPILTTLYTVVLLIVVPFQTLGGSPTFQAAAYAAVAVPSLAWLAARACAGARDASRPHFAGLPMPAVRKTAGRAVVSVVGKRPGGGDYGSWP